MRAFDAVAGFMAKPENDALAVRAIGLALSVALILMYVSLKLTPKQIGA